MSPSESSARRLIISVGLVVTGALFFARVPTLSVSGTTVRTGAVAGLVAGLLLVPAVVSHYRSGEPRKSVQWGLFAVGVPLSLLRDAPFAWLGVLAVFLSLGVGWEVDRRLLGSVSQ